MSLAQCIPQENINLTENRLQMIEKNIFSLWETLISFIEARRISREHVKNEGRYWTRQLSIRERHKGSQQSRSPHITFIISVLNPSYLLLHLSLILMMAVKVTVASSNVRDRGVDQENLDIFSEINSSNLVSTNVGPAISGQWRYGWEGQMILAARVSEILGSK